MSIPLSGYRRQAVDDKGRVAIPAKLVRAMREMAGISEEEDLEIILSPTPEGRLGVYPRKQFLDWLGKLKEPAAKSRDVQKLRLFLINHMEEQTLDKQNRVRITSEMASNYGLRGEVMVVGSESVVEIVSEKAFNEQFAAENGRLDEHMAVAMRMLADLDPAGAGNG